MKPFHKNISFCRPVEFDIKCILYQEKISKYEA